MFGAPLRVARNSLDVVFQSLGEQLIDQAVVVIVVPNFGTEIGTVELVLLHCRI